MKKYINILFLSLAFSLFFSGCDSLVEEEAFGSPTADEMINSGNVISLIGQAYADLKFMHDHWGYWGVNTLTADEGVCPTRAGGDWNDGGYWKNLNTHNWNAYGEAFRCIWNCTIEGAVLCNSLLKTLEEAQDKIDKKLYAQYVGELEVLRSYYYYLLFDSFGRIPYQEEYTDDVNPLMAPHVVWAHLVACLEKNAPNLPVVTDATRADYIGRITQGVAYTLLARLYLNAESFGCTPENVMAATRENSSVKPLEEAKIKITSSEDFYTNAARCCDAVLNSGAYDIESNYFANFRIANEGSKENIFVIQEDGTTNYERDFDKTKNKFRVTLLTLHYGFQAAYNMVERPWNGFCARPNFISLYNEEDVRGPGNEGRGTNNSQQWGWFVGPVCAQGSTTPLKNDNDQTDVIIVSDVSSLTEAPRNDGARMFKYEVDKSNTYKYCENDFVLLRLADVVLMKKEALLRGGTTEHTDVEAPFYETMKKRAFAYSDDPATAYETAYPDAGLLTDNLTGGILAERGRELAWECCRRRDLIRFGQFENVQYVEAASATRRWFPIPYTILLKSPLDANGKAIWTQNEGY